MFPNRKIIPLALFSTVLLVLAVFFIFSQRRPSSLLTVQPVNSLPNQISSLETKSESAGEVTIEVTPLVLNAGESPKLKVTFNTHSVELDFNVEDVVSLTDDKGAIVDSPKWIGSLPGSHHRSGELDFSSNLEPDVKSVMLIFKNIAGVSARTFSWTLSR